MTNLAVVEVRAKDPEVLTEEDRWELICLIGSFIEEEDEEDEFDRAIDGAIDYLITDDEPVEPTEVNPITFTRKPVVVAMTCVSPQCPPVETPATEVSWPAEAPNSQWLEFPQAGPGFLCEACMEIRTVVDVRHSLTQPIPRS